MNPARTPPPTSRLPSPSHVPTDCLRNRCRFKALAGQWSKIHLLYWEDVSPGPVSHVEENCWTISCLLTNRRDSPIHQNGLSPNSILGGETFTTHKWHHCHHPLCHSLLPDFMLHSEWLFFGWYLIVLNSIYKRTWPWLFFVLSSTTDYFYPINIFGMFKITVNWEINGNEMKTRQKRIGSSYVCFTSDNTEGGTGVEPHHLQFCPGNSNINKINYTTVSNFHCCHWYKNLNKNYDVWRCSFVTLTGFSFWRGGRGWALASYMLTCYSQLKGLHSAH